MKKSRLSIMMIFLPLLVFGQSSCGSKEIGTKTNPVIIEILTPHRLSNVIKHIDVIAKFIAEESGLETAIYAPQKSIDYIRALSNSSRKADVAILNDIGYLFASDEYGAKAELIVLRRGGVGEEITSYCPAIISVSLRSIDELNGNGIAFSDEYSTAGYLIPSYVLKERNISVSKRLFAGSYSEAIRLLLLGKIESAAIYTSCNSMNNELDARNLVLEEFPDVFSRTNIIYKAPPVPNEPVVFRKGLSNMLKERIISALLKCPENRECRDALLGVNNIVGFKRITGDEYNALRKVIKALEKDTADLIPGGWILKIKNNPELPKTGN
ncbi:MAG: phosphate/phosphite/phosphonate ABC transporter substrate-binding protein [Deltaproteobacteria bacterium]|nr:phosphate/phosphite/phosphonate ABC transporter substrate-binding protein [Deltaproteobacteria bacterium]